MAEFVGLACARDALAWELNQQLKRGSLCGECSNAHRLFVRSIVRIEKKHPGTFFKKWLQTVKRDNERFERYWGNL